MTRIVCVAVCFAVCAAAFAYEYDATDPSQGAGAEASWRAYARWDVVDEISTAEIHKHTTESRYMTPMVSFIPEHESVPSPRDVLGYIAGAEGHLTHPDDTARYFHALAEASPRVQMQSMGTTAEGRDMWLAVVSSEANLARLDEFKGYTQQLADPRGVSEQEAVEISEKAKPIFLITAGLHSPETGSPEMVMELAYRVAVSNHPDIVEIRDDVLFLIVPVTDVDGRARVIEWNERYLKDYDQRDYIPSISPPYWGKYSFHDNNRDGIQLSQKITQNYLNTFNEWHPIYSIDLHESVPLLYLAGGTGPYNTTLDPIVIREWQLLASWELSELQKHNLPGVWTWGFYTGWNPSYLLWITNNRNAMGRFYETFGNSIPATMERDLSVRKFAGKDVTSAQWYRADPPDEKVVWSLRNNNNYMQSGVLASLTFTARNGSMLLQNFWKKGRNSIDTGKNETPHAFVIPAEQRDPSRLAYLVNQLLRHGIEVQRASADFTLEDGDYTAGDFVVRLDQPYGNFARNLLADNFFPEDAEHRPYDDVSWTFGLIYGVDTFAIEDKAVLELASLERVTANVSFPGAVRGDDAKVFAIKHNGNNTLISARYRLKNVKILAAEEAFEANGETFPPGSWIIPNVRGLRRSKLEEVARDYMLEIHGLSERPDVATHNLDLPRLALYHTWTSTQNDGWVRFTLEKAGVPFAYINDDDLKRGNLNGKYDVIMMAHQGGSGKSMVHGRDPKFGAMPYTATREFPSHGVIDSSRDITGGMGFGGLANLETFLNRGGTLMLFGGAGRLATDMGLLRNVSSSMGVSTPGSNVQVKMLRRDHPVTYGFDDVDHLFRTNGPIYTVPEKYDHWIVAKFGTKELREKDDEDDADTAATEEDDAEETADAEEDDSAETEDEKKERKPAIDRTKFLLSGYVDGKSTLEKSGAILDVPRHAGGRVLLYSFNPLHRHLNHHDHNYVFNAILNWNDFPDPEPKDHPGLITD